jgi:hypothetical protein
MMTQIIKKYVNIRNMLLLFGLVLLFNLVVFPISYNTNADLELLDVQFSYSAQEAYELLEKYSETERQNYLISELTVDLIYPIIYSFMLCFTIFLVYKNETLAKLPFLVLIFDYIENFGIATMIVNYPEELTIIARISSIATTLKWLLVSFLMLIILYGLLTKRHILRAK